MKIPFLGILRIICLCGIGNISTTKTILDFGVMLGNSASANKKNLQQAIDLASEKGATCFLTLIWKESSMLHGTGPSTERTCISKGQPDMHALMMREQ